MPRQSLPPAVRSWPIAHSAVHSCLSLRLRFSPAGALNQSLPPVIPFLGSRLCGRVRHPSRPIHPRRPPATNRCVRTGFENLRLLKASKFRATERWARSSELTRAVRSERPAHKQNRRNRSVPSSNPGGPTTEPRDTDADRHRPFQAEGGFCRSPQASESILIYPNPRGRLCLNSSWEAPIL